MKKPSPGRKSPAVQESGLGVLCPDAQADGVPCQELGKDCEQCERASVRPWLDDHWTPLP